MIPIGSAVFAAVSALVAGIIFGATAVMAILHRRQARAARAVLRTWNPPTEENQ